MNTPTVQETIETSNTLNSKDLNTYTPLEDITVSTQLEETMVSSNQMEETNDIPQNHIDTNKEQKTLKYNNYEKLAPTFPWKYTILNKTKGVVAEICATSSVHACNLLGWKPKKCMLLKTIANQQFTNTETI